MLNFPEVSNPSVSDVSTWASPPPLFRSRAVATPLILLVEVRLCTPAFESRSPSPSNVDEIVPAGLEAVLQFYSVSVKQWFLPLSLPRVLVLRAPVGSSAGAELASSVRL